MDEGKKNNSLLFQIYQKYKEAKDQMEKGEAKSSETFQEPAESTPIPEKREADFPDFEVPAEYKDIKAIFALHSYISSGGEEPRSGEGIKEFEENLYRQLRKESVYKECQKDIHRFVSEMNLVSAALLYRFIQDKKSETMPEDASEDTLENIPEEELQEAPKEPPVPRLVMMAANVVGAEGWAFDSGESVPSDKGEEGESGPLPVNAAMHVKNLDNDMYALLFVTPPQEGGREMSGEEYRAVLEEHGIVYGIEAQLLEEIAENKEYLRLFIVARGTLPVDGIDAEIIDKTDCRTPKVMREDEKGSVDFKSLDLYEDISKEQVICEMIPAIEGTEGTDITGKSLPFRPAKRLALKNGKNTIISENGLLLIAAADGYVAYKNGQYNVEPTLMIPENVDYSVGNIDFTGDVVIKGDVRFGFTVKAQGNITVMGMVEGAELIAGGDIIIKKGMNGNHSGTLNAQGEVRVSYLENCTVSAVGAVYADSIISCDVYCEDSVYLKGNRGIIIGGSITALKTVEARMIGSKSQRETTIILGETPRMVARKSSLKAEIEEAGKILEKLNTNIAYLERLKGSLPAEKLSLLTQLVEQRELYTSKKKEMENTLAELMLETVDYSRCHIQSNMIFPGTKVCIGSDSMVVNTVLSKASVTFDDMEIEIGTF